MLLRMMNVFVPESKMLKLVKNCFKRTNDCIILSVPLIIFLSLVTLYSMFVQTHAFGLVQMLFGGFTVLVMFAGFSAAWFYMVKKTIKLSSSVFVFDKDRLAALFDLLKSLPKGLGKLFLPMICVTVTVLAALIIFGYIANFVAIKYFGTIDFEFLFGSDFFISSNELISKFSEVPDSMIISLNCFFILFYLQTLIFSFFTFLWIPEIVYEETNPFIAFVGSIRKVCSKFAKSLGVFIFILTIYLLLSFVNTLLMLNVYLYFLVLVLSYYFLIYFIVLIFTYYEEEFIKN